MENLFTTASLAASCSLKISSILAESVNHAPSTDHRTTVALVNQGLETITSWGRRWQVDLAQDKTQVMLISRRHHPPATPIPTHSFWTGRCCLGSRRSTFSGVEVNSTLSFTSHVRKTASKGPQAGETWPACASRTKSSSRAPRTSLYSRQPWATPHPYATRDAHKRGQQLIVPFARTETFFRSFLPRYSRLWNRVVRQTDMHQAATLHIFKCAVNAWLMPSRHN
ncbi:hypothetical protein GWK47_013810 [Chionoecetes opilio]|uniref:Uncharacterized protein n=1 Tax=Chionoecetes opilio TaxID=41210 RepID=A0A8J4Y0P9_CHIOP|nr:hypothetical protein GWK47_013810 [Chionoecetes opilio]